LYKKDVFEIIGNEVIENLGGLSANNLIYLLGISITYALVLVLSNFGLILLGGAAFGVLLYIANLIRTQEK